MKRALTIATVSVLALAGCIADDPDAAPTSTRSTEVETTRQRPDPDPTPSHTGGFGSARLAFFSDCPDLLAYLRDAASQRVTAWGLGGGPYPYPMPAVDMATAGTAAPMAMDDAVAESAPAATMPAYSGTNTQEVGVDEGDMVETDGTHVYVAGQDGVRIIDVASATVVDKLDVPDGTHQLLLDGDRLLVITQPWSGVEDTITSLYDVTDPADPSLVHRSHLEGCIVATRVIDGVARLIPGYSSYLHPVGDGLLLGVGQAASFDGMTQGTKLSLFDVSDPSDPREISSLPIGGYSGAEWDHKAFLYWPEDGTIVIPVSASWQGCGPATGCLASKISSEGGGVVVAQLQGTELVGRGIIQHDYRNQSSCWNPLQRSMIIGSEIVTIGLDQVKFTDRATLVGRDQARWGNPDDYGCSYWVE